MVMMGSSAALSRLNQEIRNINGRTVRGLLEAAAMVKGRSQAKTPVDQGVLRASHYTSPGRTLSGPVVEIGCTAHYSIYVHEDLHARHTVGQAKFLETALTESIPDILRIVRSRARLP